MKKLDIYGQQMKIMLNKQYSIQTAVGSWLTIITIFLVLIFTWFIGKDIIYKEKPISYIQSDLTEKYLNINITKQTFPFSFTMTDNDNVPLVDFSYLTIKLFTYEYELDEKTDTYRVKNLTEHDTKFCEYSDFPIIKKSLFDDAQLSLTLCPKEHISFNLFGSWHENKLKFIQISVEKCKNSTNSDILCKTNDEIKKYIGNLTVNLNLYYSDTKVLINNNTNPVEYLTASRFKYVVSEYYKEIVYTIQTHNIYTDNGFLFSTAEETNFFKLVEDFTDFRQISESYLQLLVFEIYSSNISQSYYRRYLKIPDIIASMGGILKVFSLTFLYLNTIFSEVEKNIAIVNEVFILSKKKSKFSITNRTLNLYNLHKKSNKPIKTTKNSYGENNIPGINNVDYNKANKVNSEGIEREDDHDKVIINEKHIKNFDVNLDIANDCDNTYKYSQVSFNKHFLNKTWENNKILETLNDNYNVGINKIKNNFTRENIYSPNVSTGVKNLFIQGNEEQMIKTKHKADKYKTTEIYEKAIVLNNFFPEKENSKRESNYSIPPEHTDNSKAKNFEKNVIEKYLTLINSHRRLYFSLLDVINIVCNTHCNKKIPKKLNENFQFYIQAHKSVEQYFDFIFMLKKFEEINILKHCLLDINQSKMVEIMSNPILSAKDHFLGCKKSMKNEINTDLVSNRVYDFIEKCRKSINSVDFKILKNIQVEVEKNL